MSDTAAPGTAVVNWADEMARQAVAVAKQETPNSSSIRLSAGVLSLGGQPVPQNKLEVVILDYALEHTYYEEKYNPNQIRHPACFAIGPVSDADVLAPHPNSAKPQAATCAACPKMKWGSDPNGGRGKACQERRRLIMIPANATESADKVLGAETATMKLPVMSVKFWANYVNTVAALNKRPPHALITVVGTQPNPKSQFNVTFTAQSALPDNILGAIMEKRAACQETLLKGYDVAEEEAAEAAPAKKGKY